MRARLRSLAQLVLSLAILSALFLAGDAFVRATSLPVPGNVIGLLVLFGLLSTKILPSAWVEPGADLLLGHLSLFFVPAAVAVIRYGDVIRPALGAISLIVAASTLLVLAVTGRTAQALLPQEPAEAAEPPERAP